MTHTRTHTHTCTLTRASVKLLGKFVLLSTPFCGDVTRDLTDAVRALWIFM